MNILWFGLEEQLGIEESHHVLILNKATFSTEKVLQFKPDIVIEREFNDGVSEYRAEVSWIKKTFPICKTMVWLIDTHVRKEIHNEYSKNFDYIFVAISSCIPDFDRKDRIFWLPLCFPLPEVPQELCTLEKKYPIGFVGRFNCRYMEDRTFFLKQIKDHYKRLCHFVVDYKDTYKTMAMCNIMLNKSIGIDMNFRVFEALACQNVLITNSVPDLYKVEGLSDRIFIFNSVSGAKELIDQAIHKNLKYNDVDYINTRHTIKQRILAMLTMSFTEVQMTF